MKLGEIAKPIEVNIQGTLEELVPKGIFPTGAIALDKLTFLGGEYRMQNGETMVLPTLNFLHFFIESISGENETIEKEIQDFGVVQQFFCKAKTQIRVVGKIVSALNILYPKDALDTFLLYTQVGEGVKIKQSSINNSFRINRVIIKRWDLNKRRTDLAQIPFSMDLESTFDNVFDFESFLIN